MATKKSVKKVTSKKAPVRKTATPVNKASMKVEKTQTSRSYKSYMTKTNGIILLGLVILGVLLYVFKGMIVAATVNGQPITRIQLVQELEKQNGKKTLESLVTKNLILQEMQKKNITVSDEEVTAEVKKIQDALSKQGRTLDEALAQQGLSKNDLMEQLKIQKMIEKLFSKDATVSKAEIDKYIADNKDALPQDQDEKTLRSSISDQLKQQKLTAKFQTWLEGVQKNAKIQYFVSF